MTRAFRSGYYDGRPRAGQVHRIHIIREDGPRPGRQAMCGQHAWKVTNSTPVVIDPMPAEPPDGLTWCPHCIGRLAEVLGVLWQIAGFLARLDHAEPTHLET